MNKLALEITKINKKLNNFVTKNEFNTFKNGAYNRFDEVTGELKRMNEDRLFAHELYKRLEKDVDVNKKDIKKLKQVLDLK